MMDVWCTYGNDVTVLINVTMLVSTCINLRAVEVTVHTNVIHTYIFGIL